MADITDITPKKPANPYDYGTGTVAKKPSSGLLGALGAELNREVKNSGLANVLGIKQQSDAQTTAARIAAGKAELARMAAKGSTGNKTTPGGNTSSGSKTTTVPKPSSSGIKNVTPSGSTGGTTSGSTGGTTSGSTGGTASGSTGGTTDTTQQTDPLAAIYAPLQQILANNKIAAENRYAQNQADVASITGVLSQIAPLDRQRINNQFEQSITQQQQALAGRTAEARAQQTAGEQGAATAASELGGGQMPAPTDSFSNQAVNQGVAQSNATQTNWEGLMRSMQSQDLSNVDANQSAYAFQQANALANLNRNYQTQQNDFANQGLDLASKKAQSQLDIGAAQAKAQNDVAIEQMKARAITDAAKIRAAGTMGAAQIRSGSKASSGTSGSTPTMKITTERDWEKSMRQSGMSGSDLTLVKRSVADIESRIIARRTTTDATGKTKVGKATPQDVWKAWLAENGGASAAYKDAVQSAINKGFYKYFSK